MKKIILIALFITSSEVWSQNPTISPQVINSAGDHRQIGSSGIWITDNIGEPFTETIGSGSGMITQGFIQPEVISNIGFVLETKVANLTCFKKNDGEIHLTYTSPPQVTTLSVQYLWTPATLCPNNDCSELAGLPADTFKVDVVISYSNSVGALKTDTLKTGNVIITDSGAPCEITVFTGITANGDGDNDVFTIKNIDEFPNNRVTIYNRWGQQMADIKNYNNVTNPWPSKDKLDNLLPSTYFYILELGDGSKPIKGWVELIKN